MPQLINVVLNARFSKDTTIAVKDYLTTSWPAGGAMSDNTLVAANINFDTKFKRLDKNYHVIIEKMPKQSKFQGTGGARFRVTEFKRIQVFTKGHSALDKLWKIEEEIYSLINSNIRGMYADGIQKAYITEFTPIYTYADGDITKGVADPSLIGRSRAIVTLKYDMVKQ